MSKWSKTIGVKHGLKVVVLITITSNGHLAYEIVKLSPNRLFNAKLKVFLDDMKKVPFPKYRWGLYSKRHIMFMDRVIPYRLD